MEGLLAILPNLSIGVICIGALVYVTWLFVQTLRAIQVSHERAMQERENELRKVEREIRGELLGAIARSNTVIADNGKVMERVMIHLDKH